MGAEGKLPLSSNPSGMAEKRKMPPPAIGPPPKRRDGNGGNLKVVKGEGGITTVARARERGAEGGLGNSIASISNPALKKRSLGGSPLVNVDPPYRE